MARITTRTIDLANGKTLKVTFETIKAFDFAGADRQAGRECRGVTKATAKGMTPIYFAPNTESGKFMVQIGDGEECRPDLTGGYVSAEKAFAYMVARHWDASSEKYLGKIAAAAAAKAAKAAKAVKAKVVAEHKAKIAKKAAAKSAGKGDKLMASFKAAAKAPAKAAAKGGKKEAAAPAKKSRLVVNF